jgi:hypothetical protein
MKSSRGPAKSCVRKLDEFRVLQTEAELGGGCGWPWPPPEK